MGKDFLHKEYSLIGEPLNLLERGQDWFDEIYQHQPRHSEGTTLVLGATPWLARLLHRDHKSVTLMDRSLAMLQMAQRDIGAAVDGSTGSENALDGYRFVEADWLSMPPLGDPLAFVVGDNSLSFVPFASGWTQLIGQLESRLHPASRIMLRFLSSGNGRHAKCVEEIVDRYSGQPSINYTAVRVSLLLMHWSRSTSAIYTETALETFERNSKLFGRLFDSYPPDPNNDLLTVRKYKNAGVVYYAPVLDSALDVLETAFHIEEVHFGSYDLSRNFPLIVASPRRR